MTSRYSQKRVAREGIWLRTASHCHAHLASSMAEHGHKETLIGVTLDGTRLGTDGAIWGGEFLVGDYLHF